MNKTLPFAVLILVVGWCLVANAEPISSPTTLMFLRPYAGDNMVYVRVTESDVCETLVFGIDVSKPTGKEMYAAALSALLAGAPVQVEISDATGCTGWGTLLQSIYIHQPQDGSVQELAVDDETKVGGEIIRKGNLGRGEQQSDSPSNEFMMQRGTGVLQNPIAITSCRRGRTAD